MGSPKYRERFRELILWQVLNRDEGTLRSLDPGIGWANHKIPCHATHPAEISAA
jgi:hypothetical protein